MGRTYDAIDARLAAWLTSQPVFFVATAPLAEDGSINCSPKGNRGEFVVLDGHQVAYLDQTGSGVETIAHANENGRIVVMFCAFEGPPRIVRLHGTAHTIPIRDAAFPALRERFDREWTVGERSIVVVDVRRVADSCGYAVPLMEFKAHRPTLDEWAARKTPHDIETYWHEQNRTSIDGVAGLAPSTAIPD